MLSPWSLPRYNVATSSNERVILSCYFQIYSVSLLTVNWIVFRLLLRGASFHVKGVMNMLRSNANANAAAVAAAPGPNDTVSSSLEQERYLNAIITATPVAVLREGSSWAMSDSTLSITSLVLTVGNSGMASGSGVSPTGGLDTPDVGRKNNYFGHGTISKAMSTLRHNTGRKSVGLWGAAKDRRSGSGSATLAIPHSPHFRSNSGLGVGGSDGDNASTGESAHSIRRAALYIFGEKTPIKAIRTDTLPKTDFIPVDFPEPRSVRNGLFELFSYFKTS